MPKKKASKTAKKRVKRKPKHNIEKGFDDFGKEVEALGERIGKRFDKDDGYCHCHGLGPFGPILASVVGVLLIVAGTWFIGIINNTLEIQLLTSLSLYFETNLGLFFLAFLFMSYTSYMSKAHHRIYRPAWPLGTAGGIVIVLWIVGDIVSIVNVSLGIGFLDWIVGLCRTNIHWLFVFFTLICYVALLTGHIKCPVCDKTDEKVRPKSKPKIIKSVNKTGIRRLYRSGKDKILGGVCGGIADYLGVDPVLIRLIWVVGTLAWGIGIIAYIIAWIIIPRNPEQEWDD